MKIAFLTLGCKVNSYETEQMKSRFVSAGYRIVAFSEQADIYLVNTCTVTNIADRKSRKMLHRARKMNPNAVVVAAGCYVDSAKQKGEVDTSIDLFLSNRDKDRVVELVENTLERRMASGHSPLVDDVGMTDVTEDTQKNRVMTAQFYSIRDAETADDIEDIQGKKSAVIEGSYPVDDIEKEKKIPEQCSDTDEIRSANTVPGESGISAAARAEEHTRAYIQVQNGCNQYCSYCIIPYVRGPLTSKPVNLVKEEVKQLAERGIREVVVTGIHLSSYGIEGNDARAFVNAQGKPLLELLEAIEEISGMERIRLGSLEPRIITREFVKRLAENTKICPHFHLSLQSGCDTVLNRMNRHYTTAEYQEKVKILREAYEHPAITTDIIVGFPQETAEEFQKTRDYAEQIGFAQIHVFKYSRRQGTVADQMEGQVSEQEKSSRSDALIQTQNRLMQQYQTYYLETEQDVLWEEVTEIGDRFYLTGYTRSYVRVAVPVTDTTAAESVCNTIASVRITGRLDAGILCGEIYSARL